MARGGYRPGAGRKKGTKAVREQKPTVPSDVKRAARAAKVTPLEYMLAVVNDDEATIERRDRLAIAAAPFCHARKEPVGQGKKEERELAAKDAASGKYAPPAPPKLVVNNA